MVGAVFLGPPADGALNGASADGGQIYLEGEGGFEGGMSPKAMVACGTKESVSIRKLEEAEYAREQRLTVVADTETRETSTYRQ